VIHDLPSESRPNRFFAQTWPNLKRSTGEIVKYKFRRNNFTGKKMLCSPIPQLSRVYYSFQRRKAVVVSLDPNNFAAKRQRLFSIGNLKSFQPYVMIPKYLDLLPVLDFYYDYDSTGLALTYPPDTTAFLYYFTSPNKPRIAGELRLRVVSSDDYASFESGSDLLGANGQPWSRPLYHLVSKYSALYEKLREEKLVPDDLDAALSTFPLKVPAGKYRRGQLLYTLNDTFIVDFSSHGPYLSVITEQGLGMLPFSGPFVQVRPIPITPYTGAYPNHPFFNTPWIDGSNEKSVGTALVRFERSTLPEHKGRRTVVLRFLKIITPVECMIPSYDDYIVRPKEGELHRKSRSVELDQAVWSVDIDQKSVMVPGLRLLWDAMDIL
jgi:hypothetical protein